MTTKIGKVGETQIARAEAADNANVPPGQTIPVVEAALASARGWILLAKLLAKRDPKRAAAALSLAVELAPREYYLVARRAIAGAALWNYLSPDVRRALLKDARLLATDERLHDQLLILLGQPGGPALVTRAFTGEPDKLREINRRLARERLNLH